MATFEDDLAERQRRDQQLAEEHARYRAAFATAKREIEECIGDFTRHLHGAGVAPRDPRTDTEKFRVDLGRGAPGTTGRDTVSYPAGWQLSRFYFISPNGRILARHTGPTTHPLWRPGHRRMSSFVPLEIEPVPDGRLREKSSDYDLLDVKGAMALSGPNHHARPELYLHWTGDNEYGPGLPLKSLLTGFVTRGYQPEGD